MLVYSSLVVTFVFVLTLQTLFSEENTAYVDLQKVYNSFKLKAELEAGYNQTIAEQSKKLDSLNLLLMSAKNDGQEELYLSLKDEYQSYSDQLEISADNLSANLQNQIWTQITQFFTEYGEDHKLDFIFGAAGNGGIMYADEDLDITDEVIKELNDWYEGVK